MARKPKPNPSSGRSGDGASPGAAPRQTAPQWQKENQSMPSDAPIRWFSAHEYTTSEDTLRTPKADEKPGIGAPSARQERDAVPNESDASTPENEDRQRAESPHERPSRIRRRASTRSRRDATSRTRRPRSAR